MNKYIVLNIKNDDSYYLKEVYFNKVIDYYKEYNKEFQIVIISTYYKDDDFLIYPTFNDFIYNKEGMYLYFSNTTLIYDIDEVHKLFDIIKEKGSIKIYCNKLFIGFGRIINNTSLPYIYRKCKHAFQIVKSHSIVILNKVLQKYINRIHSLNGVNIIDPNNTYISFFCNINPGTNIYPFSYIINSSIGKLCDIGPHVTIRNDSVIKDNCRIGNFVEIKNSYICNNTKIAHLSYIGDTYIGENVNIGCGVVTCNYDGINKNKTIIKDNSFIGSNVNLIAPIVVGRNSYIAAGSTISKDINDNEYVIERTKEVRRYINKNTSTNI